MATPGLTATASLYASGVTYRLAYCFDGSNHFQYAPIELAGTPAHPPNFDLTLCILCTTKGVLGDCSAKGKR
jgi:hypothetical protein